MEEKALHGMPPEIRHQNVKRAAINIPQELWEMAKIASVKSGQTFSAFCSEAISNYIQNSDNTNIGGKEVNE